MGAYKDWRFTGLMPSASSFLDACRRFWKDGHMRHVSDEERRARLAMRHALGTYRVASPEAVTQAMTVLHATEAASVYLSYWARSQSPHEAEWLDLGKLA